MAKRVDPNQINLFEAFGMDISEPQKKPKQQRVFEPVVDNGTRKTEEEMILWFAKRFKQSIAFLDMVLKKKLPGDYHGSKLWMRRWNGLWTNEHIEDADYWINLGYKIVEQPDTVCIIKI